MKLVALDKEGRAALGMVFVSAMLASMAYLYAADYLFYFGGDGLSVITIPASALLFCAALIKSSRINRASDPAVVFFLTWSLAFFLNRLRYSDLQYEWSSLTEIYILFAPLIAFIVPALIVRGECSPVPIGDNRLSIKRASLLSGLLVVLAFVILIYEFRSTGIIPILSSNMNEDRVSYSLPFVHVISEAMVKLGCYISLLIYFVRRRKLSLLIALIACSYFLVTMSRSGLVEIALVATFMKMIFEKRGVIRYSKQLLVMAVVSIAIFAALGNLRQGDSFDISDYAESRIESSSLDWFYAYYAVNMDNLAIEIDRGEPLGNPSNTLRMFIQLFQLDEDLSWYDVSYDYIGRLNLGTGMRGYINDWGASGAFALFLVLAFFITIFYRVKFRSELVVPFRAYILACCFMMPMTNRFAELIPVFLLLSFVTLDRFIGSRFVLRLR